MICERFSKIARPVQKFSIWAVYTKKAGLFAEGTSCVGPKKAGLFEEGTSCVGPKKQGCLQKAPPASGLKTATALQ
jgi:hypothetical protein